MIDEKELHIGCHIKMSDDVVYRITDLGTTFDKVDTLVCGTPLSKDWKEDGYPMTLNNEYIKPIPITSALLRELGFADLGETFEKRVGRGATALYIGIDRLINGRWRVRIYEGLLCHGNLLCRYLHQAEAFVWLTLHNELTKSR